MNLSELMPKHSKLYLRSAKRSFTIRPITLLDEAWLLDSYGPDGLAKLFAEVNILEIARITYRLMEEKDKSFFQAQEIDVYDEEGNKSTSSFGGVDLFMRMISGQEDKLAVINSLLDVVGASRPDLPKSDKKKVKKQTKPAKKWSGMKFLSYFLRNTAGKQNIYSPEP